MVEGVTQGMDGGRERQIIDALRRLGGNATVADVVRATGLPVGETENDLRALLGLYRSHLSVDEGGELVYRFHKSFARREPPPAGWARKVLRWSRIAAVTLFRFAVSATLIVYTVVFCVVALVLFIGLLTAGGDGDFDFDFGDGLGELLAALFTFGADVDVVFIPVELVFLVGQEAAQESTRTGLREPLGLEPRYVTDRYQHSGKHNRVRDAIYGFVFGPQMPDPPAFPSDREILAWIEQHKSAITITEFVSRTGLTVAEADEEMSRLMVAYDGEAHVTDDGEILYVFERLRVTAGGEAVGATADVHPAPPAWHRFEPDRTLTGNSGCRNALIGAMALFVMMSSAIGTAVLAGTVVLSFGILLSVVPLFVSILYFVIPVLRIPGWRATAKERRARNLRRAALLAVFESLEAPATEAELVSTTRGNLKALQEASESPGRRIMAGLHKVSDSKLARVVRDVLVEFDAEPDGDDGAVRYTFPRQCAELDAADAWRQGRTTLDEVGDIVYATDDDAADDVLADEIESAAELDVEATVEQT